MSDGSPAEERVRRVLFGNLRRGETPIDDFEGLRVPKITFLHELSDYESENISDALADYFGATPKKPLSFDVEGAKALHGDMFGRVWSWAGQFRLRNITSIQFTSPCHQIPLHLSDMFEDLTVWKSSMSDPVAVSALLHHRAVQIHPFVNGNGRWARMLTNIWLVENAAIYVRWPEDMVQVNPVREAYIKALKEADNGEIDPLIAMHREYAAPFDSAGPSAD
jgi:fido (protein-threonine AMPylation protein)